MNAGLWDNGGAVYMRKVERPHLIESRNWLLGTTHAVVMRPEPELVKFIDGHAVPESLWAHMERLYAKGAFQPRPQPAISYDTQTGRIWYGIRT